MQSRFFIPETMIKLPNWIFWKLEQTKDGKTTKIPYYVLSDPFGEYVIRHASSTDSDTWSSYEKVIKFISSHSNVFSGIGFVLDQEAELVFIDIDHCIDQDGNPDDRAHDFLSSLNGSAFCEISQSGQGLHFFVKGSIPRSFKNPSNGVEMYSQKRYCAITGNAILRNEPDQDQESLNSLFERYKTPDRVNPNAIPRKPSESVLGVSDTTLLRMAKKNARFSQLWEGDISMYSSHSEADLSLCGKLAFWCDRDMNRMDALFRMSGLYRPKWEREDYRKNTLALACDECKESFSEFVRRKDLEEVNEREKYFLSE